MVSPLGWILVSLGKAGLVVAVIAAESRGLSSRQLSTLRMRGIEISAPETRLARQLNVAFWVSLAITVIGGFLVWG